MYVKDIGVATWTYFYFIWFKISIESLVNISVL